MKRRQTLRFAGAAAGLPLLVACGTAMNTANESSRARTEPLRVTGTVAFRERMALDPSVDIVVQVLDVSRMDAPAVVLAEQRFRANGKQVPFPFELSVDPARIDPRMRYTVSARMLQGDQLLFVTDTAYPVLTLRHGNTASLMLVKPAR